MEPMQWPTTIGAADRADGPAPVSRVCGSRAPLGPTTIPARRACTYRRSPALVASLAGFGGRWPGSRGVAAATLAAVDGALRAAIR